MIILMVNTKAWRMKIQILQMAKMWIIMNTIICQMSNQGIIKTRYFLQKSQAREKIKAQLRKRVRKVRMTLKMSSMISRGTVLRTVVIPALMKNLIKSDPSCQKKFQLNIKVSQRMWLSRLFNLNCSFELCTTHRE